MARRLRSHKIEEGSSTKKAQPKPKRLSKRSHKGSQEPRVDLTVEVEPLPATNVTPAAVYTGFVPETLHIKDDLLLSQASENVNEVGWNFTSPQGKFLAGGSGRNIADMVQKFGAGQEESQRVSCTPPLLGLWMDEKESPEEGDDIVHSRVLRQRRRKASGTRTSISSKLLLQKLASVLEATQDEGKQKDLRDSISKLSSQVAPVNSDGDMNASSDSLPVELHFNMNARDHQMTPDRHKNAEGTLHFVVTPTSANPQTTSGQQVLHFSTDDLWTDEELFDDDSFVVRATQQILKAESYVSPPMATKRKNVAVSSTPDNRKTKCSKTISEGNIAGQLSTTSGRGHGKQGFVSPSHHACFTEKTNKLENRFDLKKTNSIERPTSLPLSCVNSGATNKPSLILKPVYNSKPDQIRFPGFQKGKQFSDGSTKVVPNSFQQKGSTVVRSPPCEQDVIDTSITDDLLASLAEPDDWLDSQIYSHSHVNKTIKKDEQKLTVDVPKVQPAMKGDRFDSGVEYKGLIFDLGAVSEDFPDDDDEQLCENDLLAILDEAELRASQEPTKPPLRGRNQTSSQEPAQSSQPNAITISSNDSTLSGSQGMATSDSALSSSQCTQLEIERKKQEALKRRASKLRLGTKK